MENKKRRIQFVLTWALLPNLLMPACVAIFPLWAVPTLYTWPAAFVEQILQLKKGILVTYHEGYLLPHGLGLLVTIPFWMIIGGAIGYFRLKAERGVRQSNLAGQPSNSSLSASRMAIWAMGIILLLIFAFGFFGH